MCLDCSGATYSAVFTQHPKGRRQQPVEEFQQQGAVVWALQSIRESVHPGDDQGIPAQLRRFHEDHTTSTNCGRLQCQKKMNKTKKRPFNNVQLFPANHVSYTVNSLSNTV